MASRSPGEDPTPVGALPTTLKVDRNLLLVGTFPDADPAQLLSSLQLEELDGDGDECGGANPYSLRVKPDPAAAAIGVDWESDWTSTNCG